MNERGGMTMAGFYILSQYRGIIRDCLSFGFGVVWRRKRVRKEVTLHYIHSMFFYV